MPTAKDPAADPSLKRLGGGRWQTRDERFTIEPQSGTWAVVDAEQTDDLGLPLVRGPFGSLTEAKAAIATARGDAPAESPLAEKAERLAAGRARDGSPAVPSGGSKARGTGDRPAPTPAPRRPAKRAIPEPPPEPKWLTDLPPDARRRARTLLDSLGADGARDPEGLVRRDLVGDVPAVAAHAIRVALGRLGEEATPAAVADLLADGRDPRLGVRWRLVDGEGRPIELDLR